MRPPPRVPLNRVVNFAELPFEALDHLLIYIKNIREKIRLMRLCKRFYDVVLEHLGRFYYRIVNRDDYLYQSEIEQGNQLQGKLLNLSRLLQMAPRLTHFTDKLDHVCFDYNNTPTGYTQDPISLRYIRYLHLNHCDRFFLTFVGECQGLRRTGQFLVDVPRLQTLHITVDRPIEFVIQRSEILRTFNLDYFLDALHNKVNDESIRQSPIPFYGVIDGSAPNLDELKVHLRYMNARFQLNDILWRIMRNCRKLTSLSVFFADSTWPEDDKKLPNENFGGWHLANLRIIEVRGVLIPWRYWEIIFAACPNLGYVKMEKDSGSVVYIFETEKRISGNRRAFDINQIVTYIKNSDKSLYPGRYLGSDICKDFLTNFKDSFFAED